VVQLECPRALTRSDNLSIGKRRGRAQLDTTTNIRSSAKRNAAFTLQHGALLTPQQPEGCVPVVVSRSAPEELNGKLELVAAACVS